MKTVLMQFANGQELELNETAHLLRALAAQWAIEETALPYILAVAARQGDANLISKNKPLALRYWAQAKRIDGARYAVVHEGVCIIPLEGPIIPKASLFSEVSEIADLETLTRDVNLAVDDPNVEAIVLDIDSPGGALAYVAEFSETVRRAGVIKPVVAYVGDFMASAALRIGAEAGEIIISSSATVGSAGVVMTVTLPNPERAAREIQFVSSVSPDKRLDPTTEGGKAKIQAYVDQLGNVFVAELAQALGISVEKVLAVGGGLLVGQQAIDAGFATSLGTLPDAIKRAKQLAAGEPFAAIPKGGTYMKLSETTWGKQAMAWLNNEAPAATAPLEPQQPAALPAAVVPPVAPAPVAPAATEAPKLRTLTSFELTAIQALVGVQLESLKAAGKVLPAAMAGLTAQLTQAYIDDALLTPVALKGLPDGTTRASLLVASLDNNKAHALTTERTKAEGMQYLPDRAAATTEDALGEKHAKEERERYARQSHASAR